MGLQRSNQGCATHHCLHVRCYIQSNVPAARRSIRLSLFSFPVNRIFTFIFVPHVERRDC